MRFTSVLLGCLLLANSLFAQAWEVGGGIGSAFYFGDLNPNFSLRRPGPSAQFFGRYNFDVRTAVKFGASYGYLSFADELSSNAFQKARNLSFRTHVVELGASLEFNFLPYLHGDREKFFTPYLMGGAGVIKFNPQAKYQDRWYDLQPLGTEGQGDNGGYGLVQPVVVVGGGFKVDLNYSWSLNLEIGTRILLFSDYLDDVSGNYPDLVELANDRGDVAAALSDRSGEVNPDGALISQPGRQRGDGLKRDSYILCGLSLVYNFATVECPAFKKF